MHIIIILQYKQIVFSELKGLNDYIDSYDRLASRGRGTHYILLHVDVNMQLPLSYHIYNSALRKLKMACGLVVSG